MPEDQVRLYVALREAAHQRLFGHVPWLRGHVLSAVETYAAGITVDREAIEEAMGRIDPTDPESMQEIALEGIFTPEDTPAQKAALARLETALALVEGWVCHVVDRAAGDRLPDVVRLAETFRRRRAAGGPAEQTFAALVGLELRPRRLREAAALWAALTEHRGIAGPRRALGPPRPAARPTTTSPTRTRSPARSWRATAGCRTSTTSVTWASTSRVPKARPTRAPTPTGRTLLRKSPSRPRNLLTRVRGGHDRLLPRAPGGGPASLALALPGPRPHNPTPPRPPPPPAPVARRRRSWTCCLPSRANRRDKSKIDVASGATAW